MDLSLLLSFSTGVYDKSFVPEDTSRTKIPLGGLMKIHSGHLIGDLTLTADLQFFRGKEVEDDYEINVPYVCPALGWTVWVSKATSHKEKAEVTEKFDFMVGNQEKEHKDLKNKLKVVLSPA